MGGGILGGVDEFPNTQMRIREWVVASWEVLMNSRLLI
jgi:hypothetical protein